MHKKELGEIITRAKQICSGDLLSAETPKRNLHHGMDFQSPLGSQ